MTYLVTLRDLRFVHILQLYINLILNEFFMHESIAASTVGGCFHDQAPQSFTIIYDQNFSPITQILLKRNDEVN